MAKEKIEAVTEKEKPVKKATTKKVAATKEEKPVEKKVVKAKTVKAEVKETVVPEKKASAKKVMAAVEEEKPAEKKAVKAKAVKAKVKEVAVKEEKPVEKEEVKAKAIKAEVKETATTEKKASKTVGKAVAAERNRLKARYVAEITPALIAKFKYGSVMEVPHVEKIVINIGVGDATTNSKLLDDSVRELGEITGQKPVVTKAKKSVASFKLREGQAIGCKVTLRGKRMYEFLDKLISISLPRVRDFRGVSKNAFDGRGNYTLGIKEQLIFPEIDYDKVAKIRGMDVVIVTTAKTDEEALTLLELLGMPFHK